MLLTDGRLDQLAASTPTHYITGRIGWELPDDSGGAPGWHLVDQLAGTGRFAVNGLDGQLDTLPILGAAGVGDRMAHLERFVGLRGATPCWMADHARALADALLTDCWETGHCAWIDLEGLLDDRQVIEALAEYLQTALVHAPAHAQAGLMVLHDRVLGVKRLL